MGLGGGGVCCCCCCKCSSKPKRRVIQQSLRPAPPYLFLLQTDQLALPAGPLDAGALSSQAITVQRLDLYAAGSKGATLRLRLAPATLKFTHMARGRGTDWGHGWEQGPLRTSTARRHAHPRACPWFACLPGACMPAPNGPSLHLRRCHVPPPHPCPPIRSVVLPCRPRW